eukprot:scaffold4201_cov76-Skeletonema_dohrnii-CCMP3373.AAC.4
MRRGKSQGRWKMEKHVLFLRETYRQLCCRYGPFYVAWYVFYVYRQQSCRYEICLGYDIQKCLLCVMWGFDGRYMMPRKLADEQMTP